MEDLAPKLAARKNSLTEQFAALSPKKKRLTREKEKRARRCSSDFGKDCSVAKLQVLRCLVVLSDGDINASMKYLDHLKRSVAEHTRTAVAEHLETWWASLPPPAGRTWLDDLSTTGEGRYALRAARKFATESRLHAWVMEQNLANGVAPCTNVVLNVCMEGPAGLLRNSFALPPGKRSRWQWMQRFRSTWGVRMGRFQNREHVGPAETLQKASLLFCPG